MRTIQRNVKIQYSLIFVFIFNCLFSSICQRDVYLINRPDQVSLADALTFQFNTYSYIFLLFLPLFIFISNSCLKTSKFNEFTITRYKNRNHYFSRRVKFSFFFTFLYRAIEITASGLVFILSSLVSTSPEIKIFSFTSYMQKIFCVSVCNTKEVFILFTYVQIIITLLYFFFSQIIILSDFNLTYPYFSVVVPIIVNYLFLVLIKANYLFEETIVRHFLPHNNTFLECVFRNKTYSIKLLCQPVLYWICIITVFNIIIFYSTRHIDYLFPTNNIDRDSE